MFKNEHKNEFYHIYRLLTVWLNLLKWYEVHVDKKNLIVSTPAFMYAPAKLHEVFDGVGRLVEEVLKLVKK